MNINFSISCSSDALTFCKGIKMGRVIRPFSLKAFPGKTVGPGVNLQRHYSPAVLGSRVAFIGELDHVKRLFPTEDRPVYNVSAIFYGTLKEVFFRESFRSIFDHLMVKGKITDGPENLKYGAVQVCFSAPAHEIAALSLYFNKGAGYHVVYGNQDDYDRNKFVLAKKGTPTPVSAKYTFTSSIREATYWVTDESEARYTGNFLPWASKKSRKDCRFVPSPSISKLDETFPRADISTMDPGKSERIISTARQNYFQAGLVLSKNQGQPQIDPIFPKDYENVLTFMMAVLQENTSGNMPESLPEKLRYLLEKHKIKHVVDVGSGVSCKFLRQLRKFLGNNDIKMTGVDLSGHSIDIDPRLKSYNIHFIKGDAMKLSEILNEEADIIFSRGLGTTGDPDFFSWYHRGEQHSEEDDAKMAEGQILTHSVAWEMTKSLSDNPSAFAMQCNVGIDADIIYLEQLRLSNFADILAWDGQPHNEWLDIFPLCKLPRLIKLHGVAWAKKGRG